MRFALHALHHRRPFAILGLTLALVAGIDSKAAGSPSDPFTPALPGRDTKPAEGDAAQGLDATVSEQQGAATYSYPIAVPPGRGGMAPQLALSYSSSGALRGGIAVGWALPLPAIEADPDRPGV